VIRTIKVEEVEEVEEVEGGSGRGGEGEKFSSAGKINKSFNHGITRINTDL